jgi:hypothetical protein
MPHSFNAKPSILALADNPTLTDRNLTLHFQAGDIAGMILRGPVHSIVRKGTELLEITVNWMAEIPSDEATEGPWLLHTSLPFKMTLNGLASFTPYPDGSLVIYQPLSWMAVIDAPGVAKLPSVFTQ